MNKNKKNSTSLNDAQIDRVYKDWKQRSKCKMRKDIKYTKFKKDQTYLVNFENFVDYKLKTLGNCKYYAFKCRNNDGTKKTTIFIPIISLSYALDKPYNRRLMKEVDKHSLKKKKLTISLRMRRTGFKGLVVAKHTESNKSTTVFETKKSL